MRIAVYHHKDDIDSAENNHYVLWGMCDIWREEGHDVEYVFGPRRVEADVAIIGVDRTVVPSAYFRAAAHCPVVINRNSKNISKRLHSTLLIRSSSQWPGPAMVKTSRNAGGIPEIRHRPRLRKFYKWKQNRFGLGYAVWMYPDHYPIFPATSEIPNRVFRNRRLVVERFRPERDGDLYCIRYFKYFGDRYISSILRGSNPVVKRRDVVSFEDVEPPPAILAIRDQLGFDYAKLDYVMHDGEVSLLDVNRTPGMSKEAADEFARQSRVLAPGLHDVLARVGAGTPPRG